MTDDDISTTQSDKNHDTLEPAAELTAVEEYEQGVRWTDYACSPEPDWEIGEKLYAESDIISRLREEADKRIEKIAENCDGSCSSIEKDVPEIRGYEIKGFACWNRADAINEFAQNLIQSLEVDTSD